MLGRRKRPITTAEIAAAWGASREARIEMRLLVAEEQEITASAYARVVEPLRQAYEETGNPAFALLAIRVLRPTGASVRGPGSNLRIAHCPLWVIEALARTAEETSSARLAEAQRRWRTMEVSIRDRLHKEAGGISDREAHRILTEWFGNDAP